MFVHNRVIITQVVICYGMAHTVCDWVFVLRIKCVPETLNRSSPSYSWIVFVELPRYLFRLRSQNYVQNIFFKKVYLALTVSLGCILKVHGNTFIFLLFPAPDFGFLIEQHVKTRNYLSGSINKNPKTEHLTIIKNHIFHFLNLSNTIHQY